jgi:hypothetical protein
VQLRALSQHHERGCEFFTRRTVVANAILPEISSSGDQRAMLGKSVAIARIQDWHAAAARLSKRETQNGEAPTEARYVFAAGYVACAAIAFAASRTRGSPMVVATGPFWLRIAVLCAVFAVLRSFDANVAVSHAIRDASHSIGLTNWKRPGPYLMIAALVAVGAAVAGLLLFRGRTLHPAVRGAAIAIILLVLLAVAQSVSLYLPVLFLQETLGPLTVSRIIEGLLIIMLAGCGAWFIRDANDGGVRQLG